MNFDWIVWDDEGDDPCNVRHVAEHGVTPDEVEEVLTSAPEPSILRSRSSQRPAVVGQTAGGRTLFVVFEYHNEPGLIVLYPITAYDHPG